MIYYRFVIISFTITILIHAGATELRDNDLTYLRGFNNNGGIDQLPTIPGFDMFQIPEMYTHDGYKKHYIYKEQLDPNDERYLQLVSGERPYEPIRIVFDTRPIEGMLGTINNETDQQIYNIINEVLPAAKDKWTQHLSVRRAVGGVPVPANICGEEYFQYLQGNTRVENADLVILVGGDAADACGDRTLAYAIPCAVNNIDRPNVGAMNFCFNNRYGPRMKTLEGQSFDKFFTPYTGAIFRNEHLDIPLVETAVHEMAHILGQSSFLFLLYRDETGAPRTERDSSGFPSYSIQMCGNGTLVQDMFPSKETVQTIQNEYGQYEQYLVTPRVQTIARNQFNCQTLIGGRLEDVTNSCIGTHWHERHYHGDLLSPAASSSSENSLSLITLALMEDSGWYKVNYTGATQPSFGLGAGCGFIEEHCIDSDTDQPPTWNVNEFCSEPLTTSSTTVGFSVETLNSVFCDPSYRSWTLCDLTRVPPDPTDSTDIRYFSDSLLAPVYFDKADHCPIPDVGLGLDCTIDAPYNVFYPGETVGDGSRCINAFYERNGDTAHQPACMQITCDETTGTVIVGQGDSQVACTYDGEEIPVPGKDGAFFVCPRLAGVCPDMLACPEACFGRGECIYPEDGSKPTCDCFDSENSDPYNCAPLSANEESGGATVAPTTVDVLFIVDAPTKSPTTYQVTVPPSATDPITEPPATIFALITNPPSATNLVTNPPSTTYPITEPPSFQPSQKPASVLPTQSPTMTPTEDFEPFDTIPSKTDSPTAAPQSGITELPDIQVTEPPTSLRNDESNASEGYRLRNTIFGLIFLFLMGA